MNEEQQNKLWNDLSEEQRAEYRKEFQQETKKYSTNDKYCDRENVFEYYTGYSNGVATTLEDLFGTHNLNPKPMTYEDVANTLFEDKKGWIIDGNDIIKEFNFANCGLPLPFNATSKKQLEKLGAINKLLNVAKYLNGDWKLDWGNGDEPKYSFCYDGADNCLKIQDEYNWCHSFVYFRTKELAEQAIQILGEETIRLALSTDY